MSMIDTLADQEARMRILEAALKVQEDKKSKKFNMKIPFKFQRAAKKDTKTAAALCIGHNKRLQWKIAVQRDGLWHIGEDKYQYDEGAMFYIKKTCVIIIFEWRIMPVGGEAEEYRSRLLGTADDSEAADNLGIKNHGQQTIIRAIEQAELDKEKPKKGGMSWLIWVLLGVGVIYLISRLFGGT